MSKVFIFQARGGIMYVSFRHRVKCTTLTTAPSCPLWRALGIFNLLFKCNGKKWIFFFFFLPLPFLLSMKVLVWKEEKRKPMGRKHKQYRRNETREKAEHWRISIAVYYRHTLGKIFFQLYWNIIGIHTTLRKFKVYVLIHLRLPQEHLHHLM